jgi:hypothetical protein
LSVPAYRSTVDKVGRLLDELQPEWVLFAHFPPMQPPEVRELLVAAHRYIDMVETTIMRVAASQPTVTLEQLWKETCARHERLQEFRSLNMVDAHVKDLIERGFLREVGKEVYEIR